MSKENCELLNERIEAFKKLGVSRDDAINNILVSDALLDNYRKDSAKTKDELFDAEYGLLVAQGKLSFYRIFTGALIALIGVMAYVGDFL